MDLGGDTCVFCDVNIEVSAHLFVTCSFSHRFGMVSLGS